MLFQQPAKLGVLRPQESLRIVHIAMIVDRDAARQDGTARAATRDHLIRKPGMPPSTAQGAVVFRADIPGPLLCLGCCLPAWVAVEHPFVPSDWRLTRCLEGRFAQRVSLSVRR
jgi:hypothetical protein